MLVKSKNEAFTYVDLFAGRGDFEDEAEGSPMLAFDIIERHILQDSDPGNHFKEIRIVAIDNDEETAKHLKVVLGQRMENSPAGQGDLEVYTGDRNWETYDVEIKQLLSQSKWGFIFADPFSTELDIEKLIRTMEAHKVFKDILVFTNYRTLSRQSRRKHANDIERVSKSLGIKEEQINQNADFREVFRTALKRKFSSLKAFTIGVAIPVAVGGKLIRADYFYLVLATDSIVVADSFLIAYENAVTQERTSGRWGRLFEGHEILDTFSRSRIRIRYYLHKKPFRPS
jgi:three-Cys-motif partner protein